MAVTHKLFQVAADEQKFRQQVADVCDAAGLAVVFDHDSYRDGDDYIETLRIKVFPSVAPKTQPKKGEYRGVTRTAKQY